MLLLLWQVTYSDLSGEDMRTVIEDLRANRNPEANTRHADIAQLLRGGMLVVRIMQARFLPPTSIFKLGYASRMYGNFQPLVSIGHLN